MFDKRNRPFKPIDRKRRIMKCLIALAAIILACFLAVVIYVGIQISKAPDISSVDASPEGYLTVILDGEGNKVDSLYMTESNRVYVKLDEIPEDLANGFVAIEDSRFYKHFGIDLRGIARAAFRGIKNGGFSEGASTITQQLLKNNVLVTWTDEKTFTDRINRKLKELYLAIQLERKYDKDWILENYMNTINLGGGTRGVQVAAQYYFGMDVSELDLAQCALIAGITKNPSRYNPFYYPEDCIGRQHLVLGAMLKNGYISEAEYDSAMAEDVLATLCTGENDSIKILSWFEDAMLRNIVTDLMNTYGIEENDAWDLVYSGGLTIYSTMDTQAQSICERIAADDDYFNDSEEISIVMTDTKTGAVVAIIGGRGEKTASLVYNRAASSIRQPGSTIKIIGEYAAGIDLGMFDLGTVVCDEPYTYKDGTSINNATGTFGGMTTIRKAIYNSINTVALKEFNNVGQDSVVIYLKKFGITTLDENDYHEPLAIGGTYNGVTNLEMTAAYNAIANGGIYVKPYYYTKVLDHDGNVILAQDTTGERIIDQSTADLLTLAMEDVFTKGTGSRAYFEGTEIAGKSGTTDSMKDLWFIGFSDTYTCGVWGGYDNNQRQDSSNYVKDIWRDVMKQANSTKGYRSLVDTSDYVRMTICTKCGKLAKAGLCDSTVQGDQTCNEYFIDGTAPAGYCDCHVKITLCNESGKLSGFYCPNEFKQDYVYLYEGAAGTYDEESCLDVIGDEKCDIHTHLWDLWFKSGSKKPFDPNASEEEYLNPQPEEEPEDGGDGGEDPHGGHHQGDGGSWTDFFENLFN